MIRKYLEFPIWLWKELPTDTKFIIGIVFVMCFAVLLAHINLTIFKALFVIVLAVVVSFLLYLAIKGIMNYWREYLRYRARLFDHIKD